MWAGLPGGVMLVTLPIVTSCAVFWRKASPVDGVTDADKGDIEMRLIKRRAMARFTTPTLSKLNDSFRSTFVKLVD